MTDKRQEPLFDDWAEYKRLVLSELERLNQAVEKLKDQCVTTQNQIQVEISRVRESLNSKINDFGMVHPTKVEIEQFKKDLEVLEGKFHLYTKEQQEDYSVANKWAFWGAVVTIIGSLVASLVSLFVVMNDK